MQFCHFSLSIALLTRAHVYIFKDTRTQEKKHANLIFFVKCFPLLRKDGRVVYCVGLENRSTERYRGFESLSFRLNEKLSHVSEDL